MEMTGQTRSRDQISIDVREPDEDLVASIREKMENISYLHCICRVDKHLSEPNPRAYIPDKVSIGPYHHNSNEVLKAMEDQKWHYVHTLLNRKPNLEASIDDCVTALREVEHRARACYHGGIGGDCSSDQFLQMMFVDGCFIIELFLKYSIKSLRRRNDPIFSTPGMLFDLRCDLILLENQIPLFVLQRLFQVVPKPKECTSSFAELAFRFFRNMIPGDPKINREKFNQEAHHLLDIICHCLLPTYPREVTSKPSKFENDEDLPSLTELKASGVRVKIARTDNLLDIKFSKGVLRIPPIVVHQYTESLFRNLIALEACSTDSMQHITSYAVFMKTLLRVDKDVKLLKRREILTSYDVSEKEVDKLFAVLCSGVKLKEYYYDGLCEQLNEYKEGIGWHKKLKYGKKHGKNPQLRSILLVAMLVLLLTLVGTLFSVLSFVHRF
ncbi:hypothetical protein JCGZ_19004 [Jatropha curcas]|uniref:Uncharacterized protein n=1 Tax=Jatropha curcas TaxID=180498 RepID=A0A067K7X9_JATCU|nr:UPF0481 protein At3g47200 [Jatropha curcas]KDP27924.1 hypothetical protein JCGZ_19004 [Jatropha curcas]